MSRNEWTPIGPKEDACLFIRSKIREANPQKPFSVPLSEGKFVTFSPPREGVSFPHEISLTEFVRKDGITMLVSDVLKISETGTQCKYDVDVHLVFGSNGQSNQDCLSAEDELLTRRQENRRERVLGFGRALQGLKLPADEQSAKTAVKTDA